MIHFYVKNTFVVDITIALFRKKFNLDSTSEGGVLF